MNKLLLKQKLDTLEELNSIKEFLSYYDDDYTINIKRVHYSTLSEYINIFKRNLAISKKILKKIIDEMIIHYEKEIDEALGASNEK